MKKDKQLRVIMLRHGETVYNIEKRLQSSKDRLTEKGKFQIEEAAKRLVSFNISYIISSDEKRAVESAEIISKYIGIQFVIDSLIREKNSGNFSDELANEVDWSQVKGDFYNKKLSGGESIKDVIKRANIFIKNLTKFKNGEDILIVSHGSFLRIIFCIMMGYNIENVLLNYELPNAKSITLLRAGEKWAIEKSDLVEK